MGRKKHFYEPRKSTIEKICAQIREERLNRDTEEEDQKRTPRSKVVKIQFTKPPHKISYNEKGAPSALDEILGRI